MSKSGEIVSKSKMNEAERERFENNIRFLYAKIQESENDNLGYIKMVNLWEAKDQTFPMGVNNYQNVFRKKEPISNKMTVSTAVTAIEALNFYLVEPFEVKNSRGEMDHRACFDKFIEVKFTENNYPKIRSGNLDSCYEKFIQDYYVYMPTESEHFISVGFLSMYMTEDGVQAYLICHLRRTDVLAKKEVWNIFKDYDFQNVNDRFWKEFGREDGGQPICRLYKSKSVSFIGNQMICDFVSVRNKDVTSQLFLDISSCTAKETPDSLLYQFGCGAITHILGSSIGFSASHIFLVNAMANTEEREFALKGKRSEKFYENYLDPIGIPYIKQAMEECNVQHFTCNAKQSADYYRWNKAQNMEQLRGKKTKEESISKKELAELIEKLQNLYDTMES